MIKKRNNITITCPSKDFQHKGLFLMIDDGITCNSLAVEWQELLDIMNLVDEMNYELFVERISKRKITNSKEIR